ncbi:50S ribosomal protein L24 [Candidatus Saccharibacteria bacterium]|nr:50S ribosomal protein L24 [Candidatus Saccharibacteria bacterium]MBQ3436794.1 50S ribosomal protein L24 [Candidatus Saccharibacteria bacterium]
MKAQDKVLIIAGDNKGTEAKIVKVDRKKGLAYLEGIGMVERHMKKSYLNPNGGKKTIHVGIDMSNLKLVEAAKAAKTDKNAKQKKGAK